MASRIVASAIILSSVLTVGSDRHVLCWPDHERYTAEAAERMVHASQTRLSEVYAPLAEYIVSQCALSEAHGVGIDVGSGPGSLILELCERTKLHWVNADINTHFFSPFYKEAAQRNVGHRVGAVFADVHYLPFRDNYARVIVSRGSYHFWTDKPKAFGEIYRVLAPDGVAFVGRGFPPTLPADVARRIRSGRRFRYDVRTAAAELEEIMRQLGIDEYNIIDPQPNGATDVNYGVWVRFRKTPGVESIGIGGRD